MNCELCHHFIEEDMNEGYSCSHCEEASGGNRFPLHTKCPQCQSVAVPVCLIQFTENYDASVDTGIEEVSAEMKTAVLDQYGDHDRTVLVDSDISGLSVYQNCTGGLRYFDLRTSCDCRTFIWSCVRCRVAFPTETG